jgi:MFS family permease
MFKFAPAGAVASMTDDVTLNTFTSAPDLGGLRRAVAATATAFFVNGLLFASWTAHIPQVKARLGLTDAGLGVALLGTPLGSVMAMVISARLLPWLGSRRMVLLCVTGYGAAGPLVGLAGSDTAPSGPALLFGALFLWGGFAGAMDVSMNTQAVTVERARGRPLMSGLHAFWSIGTFAGAGAGVAGVGLGLPLTIQLIIMGIPALAVTGWLARSMYPDARAPAPARPEPSARDTSGAEQAGAEQAGAEQAGAEQAGTGAAGKGSGSSGRATGRADGRRRGGAAVRVLSLPVLALGLIACASMLAEGASADWSAVYLRGTLGATATVAGLAYTAYSLTMVSTRLAGNRLLTRFRASRMLPVLAAVATAGIAGGLAAGQVGAAIVGFGLLGFGLALVVPTVFSAAGRLPGLHPGTAIASVSAFGWAGYVCGPPLIGALASATSLAGALGLLPVLTLVIVAATARSRVMRQPDPGPPGTPGGQEGELRA